MIITKTHTHTHTLTHTQRHTLTHWHKLSGKMQATFSIDERQIMSNSIELNFHWNNWIDWGNSCWPTSSVISPSNTRPNEQCHKRRMQKWLDMQTRRPGPVERDTGRRVLGERGRGLKVKVIKHLVLARTHGEQWTTPVSAADWSDALPCCWGNVRGPRGRRGLKVLTATRGGT